MEIEPKMLPTIICSTKDKNAYLQNIEPYTEYALFYYKDKGILLINSYTN